MDEKSLKGLSGVFHSTNRAPIDQVVSIGRDTIVIPNSTGTETTAA